MTDNPRLISRAEAAAYCGITPTCFSMWVATHKMPPSMPGTRKWDKRAIDAKLDEIIEFAGIGDAVYLPMSALSSGMAARLRFAISTARVPEVLMIDEALATGDAAFRQRSKERIEQIREAAGTIFFVSHSLASVRSMCTRAIWLDKGMVRMDGDVDTVADAYRDHIKADKREARRARRAKLGEEEWRRRREARRARREARKSAEAAESR